MSASPLGPLARLLLVGALAFAAASSPGAPVAVPVLVITTYELGKDRGDDPGELQFWAERQNLTHEIAVPGLDHPLLTNDRGLYAIVSGTTSRCTSQIMALACDPRFDFTKTYFVLSGIAGGDPNRVSLGSAVWVETAVDGNPAFEIDSREIPASWPYGIVSLGTTAPNKAPADIDAVPAAGLTEAGPGQIGKVAFKLNPSLTKWAYDLTKDIPLENTAALQATAKRFSDYPQAQLPPHVMVGDSLGGDRFFHGAKMMEWAEDWVRIYTRGSGSLAMSDCEDQGVCIALERLSLMGKVDFERLLILRTACNFVVPPQGVTPEASLFGKAFSGSTVIDAAYIPALEADYRVGSAVTGELLSHWDTYRDHTPGVPGLSKK